MYSKPLKNSAVKTDRAVEIVFAKSPHDSSLRLIRSWNPEIAFSSIGLSIGGFHGLLFGCDDSIKVCLKSGPSEFFGQTFILEVIKSSCLLVKKLTLLVT